MILACALLATVPAPHDWPQYLGPARNGVSTETGWVAEGRAAWAVPLGLGYSSVVVAEGRLFTMGYDEEAGADVIFCLDAETCEERWRHEYPAEEVED